MKLALDSQARPPAPPFQATVRHDLNVRLIEYAYRILGPIASDEELSNNVNISHVGHTDYDPSPGPHRPGNFFGRVTQTECVR